MVSTFFYVNKLLKYQIILNLQSTFIPQVIRRFENSKLKRQNLHILTSPILRGKIVESGADYGLCMVENLKKDARTRRARACLMNIL